MIRVSSLNVERVASGLLLPEGPVALRDGSVLFVEVGRGTLSRLGADGAVTVVSELGGGPNGVAIGPDGAAYVCNNGGGFAASLEGGELRLTHALGTYIGGMIQRVDLASGEARVLYAECDGEKLLAPNDLVFDRFGAIWFTDFGLIGRKRKTFGGIFHANPDGTQIKAARKGLLSPNGIGLSPDGRWVYWADTMTARLWRAEILGPGILADYGEAPGECICTVPGYQMLDSLAVEADGRVCIASTVRGGIMAITPEGEVEYFPIADDKVTNICFGGEDNRDVWITAAAKGELLRARWPRPGLALAYEA